MTVFEAALSFNVVLSFALVVMFLWSVYNHMAARRRDYDMARVIHRIDDMLTAWAQHWGAPPEEIKPILAAIIERWKNDRRKTGTFGYNPTEYRK